MANPPSSVRGRSELESRFLSERPPFPFAATLVVIVGFAFIVGGVFGWSTLRENLGKEGIVVSEDARFYAGTKVDGPFSAYAQAEVLSKSIEDIKESEAAGPDAPDSKIKWKLSDEQATKTRLLMGILGFVVSITVMVAGFSFVTIGVLLSGRGTRRRPDPLHD